MKGSNRWLVKLLITTLYFYLEVKKWIVMKKGEVVLIN